MTRVKLLAAPHKGLRNMLSKFSLCLGLTDFQDLSQLRRLKDLGHEMFTLLNHHAHTENEYTLRHLERRAPGASKHDKEDHQWLEPIQKSLRQQLSSFSGKESQDQIHLFYLDFSRFQSQYLEHIFEEEMVTEILLQNHFTDAELIEQRIVLMQSFELPILFLWLKYIIPAQPESENARMLLGLKASVSDEAFENIMTTIKGEIDAQRFHSLSSNLYNSDTGK